MKMCSNDFNEMVKFFSDLSIVSNIFYLIAGLILLCYKKYFFGLFFTIVSIISSYHHYYNDDLQTCKKVIGLDEHSYLSKVDVISVNILIFLLLGYLFFIHKPIKIHNLILIGLCGAIGIFTFYYSEIYGKQHERLKDRLLNIIINNRDLKRNDITELKRKIIYKKILYNAVHGIWHIITGLVGVMIALYIINK